MSSPLFFFSFLVFSLINILYEYFFSHLSFTRNYIKVRLFFFLLCVFFHYICFFILF
jgi:hypothetical protein